MEQTTLMQQFIDDFKVDMYIDVLEKSMDIEHCRASCAVVSKYSKRTSYAFARRVLILGVKIKTETICSINIDNRFPIEEWVTIIKNLECAFINMTKSAFECSYVDDNLSLSTNRIIKNTKFNFYIMYQEHKNIERHIDHLIKSNNKIKYDTDMNSIVDNYKKIILNELNLKIEPSIIVGGMLGFCYKSQHRKWLKQYDELQNTKIHVLLTINVDKKLDRSFWNRILKDIEDFLIVALQTKYPIYFNKLKDNRFLIPRKIIRDVYHFFIIYK